MDIDPHYPVVDADKRKDLAGIKALLEAEAPKGMAADPFAAELATGVGEEEERKESKQARRQREEMAKVRAEVAKA